MDPRTSSHGRARRALAKLVSLPLVLAALLAAAPAPPPGPTSPVAPVAPPVAPVGPTTASAATSSGPVLDGDFADPFVLRDGDAYYAYGTGTGTAHLQAARSGDLASWTRLADPLPTLPSWAASSAGLTWAPSVLRRGARYVLYYTTRDASSGFQCIGRATATRPEGPFTDDTTQAFVCQVDGETRMCGSIDPSPFVDADGRAYLLWKSDENATACRGAARLWSRPLSDDGLSLVGSASALLATDRSWEAPLVEGPSMVRDGSSFHLFYSANWYDSASYAVGHARCDGPLGPCTKTSVAGPLFASDGALLGPGGQELFTDAKGDLWMAHHGWTAPASSYAQGGARSLHLARVTFANGMPRITRR